MSNIRRRQFLQLPALMLGQAPAQTGIRLGFDSYSIRDLRWKAPRLLEYAASLKLDALQISIPGELESDDPAYLRKLREDAARLGISLDAAMGSICPESRSYNPKAGDPVGYLLRGLWLARELGARVMRCFVGSPEDRRSGRPVEALIDSTLKVLRSARSQALDLGVKIAIENHGEMQSEELRSLVEEAGRDLVGVCLDIGNPVQVLEDPVQTYETLGPYAFTTHVRDSVVWEHPRGVAFQWVALGDGCMDLKAMVELHRRLCPQAPVQLEIITGRPPQVLACWEQDFWKMFPRTRATDFARFLRLARRCQPFQGSMMIAGPGPQPEEFRAALRRQQQYDLERSLEYAK
ncbi:MAG: sugar phosphate isomerase/epimerase family protein, partial [Bryobacteraceae bacterium]